MASLLTFFFIIMFFTSGHADNRTGAIWNDEWHALFPNTPMPNVIEDLIKTDANGRMSASRFPVHFRVHGSSIGVIFSNYRFASEFEAAVNSFFLEKDMYPEMEIKGVSFAGTITGNTFIPRREADSIPFSSTKLVQILNRLSIAPGSEAAKHVEETLRVCEASHLKGEIKFCATSLESMIDFVISELGSGDYLKVIATTVKDGRQELAYKITAQGTKMPGDKLVICHPLPYPYTVFYCHVLEATKAYVTPLVGKLGSIVSAVAVCHNKNTNHFDPILFKMLKVKPGTPLCHFLPKDHLVWFPNNYLNPLLHEESS